MTVDVALGLRSSADRRQALFREHRSDVAKRWVLGTAWALKPKRIAGIPALTRMVLSEIASRRSGLPDAEKALASPAGLCGIARDFSSPTILDAYQRTLFPFAHIAPLKWWSPAERCVLYFDEFHVGKRLRRQMRQDHYRVTFDTDFDCVIKHCAGRRQGKWHLTWITPQIMNTFSRLFDEGHAHSFELWDNKNELVGGGYGLAVGRVFFTESQFSLNPNTSKIGFTVLNWHLARWGFVVNDGKWMTPTIEGMGFRQIPRAALRDHLADASVVHRGRWEVESDLVTISAWKPDSRVDGKTALDAA